MGRLWNEEYGMLICVKALPAVPVIVVMCSVTFLAIASLFEVTTDGCPKCGKSLSVCSFSHFSIKFSIA